VGALPVEGGQEPCHQLVHSLEGSRILAFEPDEELCRQLNEKATPGISYFPVALGGENGSRMFYETEHPMCSSLYRPDPRWDEYFNNLHFMREKQTLSLETVRVDTFLTANEIGRLDFIKIDVQGAEYEIFEGAGDFLKNVLFIVCEVEFVPLYQDQPLFGDVDRILRQHGFMFHKFLGLAGRAMKPLAVNNDANFPVQHMWSDAIFVRDLLRPDAIADEDLLRIAVMLDLYGSVDAGHFCLARYDFRRGTDLAGSYLSAVMGDTA
jgi:FkbM family methyltransferase